MHCKAYSVRVILRGVLIDWSDNQHAVIALFAGDKARMGDAFYDTVGTRADAAIEKWKRGKP